MTEVVKAIIIKDNKYLLIKRKGSSRFFPNEWDLPGGKVDQGEGLIDALKREILEETSLSIIPGNMIKEFPYSEQDRNFHFNFFSIKEFSGEIKLSEDHTDFIWLFKKELGDYDLAPAIARYFGS